MKKEDCRDRKDIKIAVNALSYPSLYVVHAGNMPYTAFLSPSEPFVHIFLINFTLNV